MDCGPYEDGISIGELPHRYQQKLKLQNPLGSPQVESTSQTDLFDHKPPQKKPFLVKVVRGYAILP